MHPGPRLIIQSGLSLNQHVSGTISHISDKVIRVLKNRIYNLPMHVHKHHLFLLEPHSKSFEIWSAIIRIKSKGKILDYEIDS